MSTSQDIKDNNGLWIKTFTFNGEKFFTKSFQVWRDMVRRCTPGSRQQICSPNYIGCTCSESFKDFQKFAEWYTKQIGYGVLNYSLDKDLLSKEKKFYSEETCLLIPGALNAFVRSCHFKLNGVTLHKGKIRATINRDGKIVHLGYFKTDEDAKKAYLEARKEEALRWQKRLKEEFVVDPRAIKALGELFNG